MANLLLVVGPRRLRAPTAHRSRRIFEAKDLAGPAGRATARGRMRADAKRATPIPAKAPENRAENA